HSLLSSCFRTTEALTLPLTLQTIALLRIASPILMFGAGRRLICRNRMCLGATGSTAWRQSSMAPGLICLSLPHGWWLSSTIHLNPYRIIERRLPLYLIFLREPNVLL